MIEEPVRQLLKSRGTVGDLYYVRWVASASGSLFGPRGPKNHQVATLEVADGAEQSTVLRWAVPLHLCSV